MIEAHLENVLTYCEHRITNATIEGLWDADDLTDSPTAYFLVRLRVAN
jgi:hypothetical protein